VSELVAEATLGLRLPPPGLAREIRRAAGVSRQRLADELGVHVITVARWERGTRTPRGRLRVAYSRVLAELAQLRDVTS
jgi:DNA-binding transcriptional regulator YiaG